jgi:hypothetical protein
LTRGPFEELTASLDHLKVKQWKEVADNAVSQRGDSLDIYTLKMEKGINYQREILHPCINPAIFHPGFQTVY